MGSDVSAGPSTAISATSASSATPTPLSVDRQLRVVPTAMTIVSASTVSARRRGIPRSRVPNPYSSSRPLAVARGGDVATEIVAALRSDHQGLSLPRLSGVVPGSV